MKKNIIYIVSRVLAAIFIAIIFVALQRKEFSWIVLYIAVVHGGIIGLIFNSFMLFKRKYINFHIRRLPFLFIVLLNSGLFLFLLLIGRALSLMVTKGIPFRIFPMDDPYFVNAVLFIFSLMLLFNLMDQVSLLTGQKQLFNFAIGKYRTAQKESRMIMFVDITDSTKIAEQIGDIKFLSLLDDFFSILKNPLQDTDGEIYKYIGDEAIITWDKTKLDANLPIAFFFKLKEVIKNRETYFKEKYNVFPEFKAGLHFGSMMIGELGSAKKEIALIGDSLNTTSRILDIGKRLDEDLVISEVLGQQLKDNKTFELTNLGEQDLKGKTENMLLYSVRKM